MTEGYSVRQLSELSGCSPTKLRRILRRSLQEHPPDLHASLSTFRHLIFDGTFLHRPTCIVALMEAENKMIVAGQYGISEFSPPQLRTFLQPLKRKGLEPLSCTMDGNPQVFKVLKETWPNIIIQRCLVHVQRQGLSWCRRVPKRTDAKYLRKLFSQVCYIDNEIQQNQFIAELLAWEQRFGPAIAKHPEKGKVFSDIKRARSMMTNALPNMFHYLENAKIPKTTNALEGYYSRLKQLYRMHRGMRKESLYNYFSWYFFLKPR